MLLALLCTRSAHGECEPAQPSLELTYPDATTQSVPANAVFWAVSRTGTVNVSVDGVALTARGAGPVDKHQFAPAAPLADGQHELVASVGTERRSIRFNVAPRPPSSGSASIDTVTVYPLELSQTELLNPPEAQYDTDCMDLVAALDDTCNDQVPEALTRVTYASQGDVIAYLVQGRALVPPQCSTYWMPSSERPKAKSLRVAAVLPTGVAAEQEFDGSIEVRTRAGTHSELLTDEPSGCSLGVDPSAPSGLAGLGLALATWLVRRRRARP
jgi:hypothetical protein